MTNEHDTPEADLDATMIAEVRAWRERLEAKPTGIGVRWEMRLMLTEVDALLRAAAERDELKATLGLIPDAAKWYTVPEIDRAMDDMRRVAREVNAEADGEPEIPAAQVPQTHAPQTYSRPCRLCTHLHPHGVLCSVSVADLAGIPRACECTA